MWACNNAAARPSNDNKSAAPIRLNCPRKELKRPNPKMEDALDQTRKICRLTTWWWFHSFSHFSSPL